VELIHTAPENHARKVERAIQTIKNKARASIYGLNYVLPKKLVRFAFEYATLSSNMVPNINFPTTTPNEMVCKRKVDMKTYGRASFGQIGMFRVPKAEQTSTGVRAESGIVVGKVHSSHGVLKVFLPSRNKVLRRFKYVKLSMTEDLSNYLQENYNLMDKDDFGDLASTVPNFDDPNFDYTTEEVPYFENPYEVEVNWTVKEALEFNPTLTKCAIKDELIR
jgi:hypothetical protein